MLNQQIKETAQDMSMVLHEILLDMGTCITEQETIIIEERQAMQVFDAAKLAHLVEQRARSQSTLHELESRCRRIMSLHEGHNKMEYLINHCAASEADNLHSIRIELARRMQTLERDHVENHIRLRAAWNVTTSILQQIGAVETNQTYQNTAYAHQAIR